MTHRLRFKDCKQGKLYKVHRARGSIGPTVWKSLPGILKPEGPKDDTRPAEISCALRNGSVFLALSDGWETDYLDCCYVLCVDHMHEPVIGYVATMLGQPYSLIPGQGQPSQKHQTEYLEALEF